MLNTLFSAHCKQCFVVYYTQVQPVAVTPCRLLSLHEHYSLDFMSKYGVTVPKGSVAHTPLQAKAAAAALGKVTSCMHCGWIN